MISSGREKNGVETKETCGGGHREVQMPKGMGPRREGVEKP